MGGRKVWTQETLAVPDLQEFLQDQVVMVFPNAAARDVAIPASAVQNGMVCWLDSPGRHYYYHAGAWRALRPGGSTYLVNDPAWGYNPPASGTPALVTSFDFTATPPAESEMRVEANIPRVGVPASVTLFVRMVLLRIADGVVLDVMDAAEFGPSSATTWTPLKLAGRVVGDGTAKRVALQAWATGAGCVMQGSNTSGGKATLTWRVV